MANEKLYMRIFRFHAKDETGTAPFGEWGSDEMYLTGLTFGPTGLQMLPLWKMGKYNDGTKCDPPGRPAIATFDLNRVGNGGAQQKDLFPATFAVVLIPWEADGGGDSRDVIKYRTRVALAIESDLERALSNQFPEAPTSALHRAARQWTRRGIDRAIDELAGSTPKGAIVKGSLSALERVGVDVRGALAQSFSEILGGLDFDDDIFTAQAATVRLDAPVRKWRRPDGHMANNSDQFKLRWRDHNSDYRLTYDWVSTRKHIDAFGGF